MQLLAGRYELAEPLGAGGMARVVAAYDHRLRRRVAIKLVREELTTDPTSRERLLREARAAAGLQHPNTVGVHDVGEEDGQAFVVMELVEGQTLADRLREVGRLSPEEVVAISGAVLSALEAAHARGLVHRDVKPGNVLLPAAGGVKLADFGIAKALDAATGDLTATGQILGTPRYLAPEQVAGQPATPASDLYSLGAVLYECLAGRPPFDAESAIALALAHQREPVPPLGEEAPWVPPALAGIVERALAKDPAGRPADATTMREAVLTADLSGAESIPARTAVLAGDATQHGTQALPTVSGGSSRRGWWPVAAAVAVLVVAGVAAALTGDDGAEAPPLATDADDAGGEGVVDEPVGAAEADDADDAPADLGDLAAHLARDPDAAGERGTDLLEELLELRGESGEDRREDARELVVDIAEWLADGELDEEVGRQALALLEPEVRAADGELEGVGDLFIEIALDLDAWGEKGGDLHGKLEDLLGKDAQDRAKEAGKLLDDVERWREKDELDAARGRQAIEVLRPVAGR